MSLSSDRKISGVPRFNGDVDKYPIFSVKFKGLVYRLGTDYVKALKRSKPYNWQRYGEEIVSTVQNAKETEKNHSTHVDGGL